MQDPLTPRKSSKVIKPPPVSSPSLGSTSVLSNSSTTSPSPQFAFSPRTATPNLASVRKTLEVKRRSSSHKAFRSPAPAPAPFRSSPSPSSPPPPAATREHDEPLRSLTIPEDSDRVQIHEKTLSETRVSFLEHSHEGLTDRIESLTKSNLLLEQKIIALEEKMKQTNDKSRILASRITLLESDLITLQQSMRSADNSEVETTEPSMEEEHSVLDDLESI